MVPFITEHVWQVLIRAGEAATHESVHLTSFPTFDADLIDEKLSTSVALSRRLVELGRSARAESKIKIRQPLARALVAASGWKAMDAEIRSHVAEELNVLSLEELASENEDLVSVSIKANFRSIGARYGADVQAIAKAVTDSDATALVREVRSKGNAEISYGTSVAQISEEDLVITETPKEGWSVASHSGESLALDLALTPELIEAGLMREVIRSIQEERKNSGFDISDRIVVEWSGSNEIAQAINKYSKEISDEVLAVSMSENKALAQGNNEIALGLALKRAN
jgi:isoleucyl-tRNA synthetase